MRVACTSSFLSGVKKLKKRHQEDVLRDLNKVLEKLSRYEITTQKDNHSLKNARGLRDIHIRHDIILLYKYEEDLLTLSLKLIADDITSHDNLSKSLEKERVADKSYDPETSNRTNESSNEDYQIGSYHIYSPAIKDTLYITVYQEYGDTVYYVFEPGYKDYISFDSLEELCDIYKIDLDDFEDNELSS